jgi:hypothetical protein
MTTNTENTQPLKAPATDEKDYVPFEVEAPTEYVPQPLDNK